MTLVLLQEDPSVPVIADVVTNRRADYALLHVYLLRFATAGAAILLALRSLASLNANMARLLPLAPFIGWVLLSALWTDAPLSTRNATAALASLLATACAASARLGVVDFARAMLIAAALIAATSLAWAVAAPTMAVHQATDYAQAVHAGAWRGIYDHKNTLGGVAAALLAAALCSNRAIVPAPAKWSAAAALAALVLLSRSATGLAIVPLALFVAAATVRGNAVHKLLASALLALLAAALLLSLSELLAAIGRDPSLTGRTAVWNIAFDFIGDRPIGGHGFMSLAYGGFAYRANVATGVGDPHNGYIDLMLGTGAVGLLLFLAIVPFAWARAARLAKRGGAERAAAMMLVAMSAAWLLSSLSESNIQPLRPVGALGVAALVALLFAGGSAGPELVDEGAEVAELGDPQAVATGGPARHPAGVEA